MSEIPIHIQRSICKSCSHCRVITSGKGSVFLMCQQGTPPKYPPQPVTQCGYFQEKIDGAGESDKKSD